ncbi:hypothetical protein [Flavobacterium sp. MMS24-S5]|uniref:hypothetical protein n=1 Tax=Flavobacterium sp. MMS24-S5 TaxID=3416605 RepID=UPI003CFE0F33
MLFTKQRTINVEEYTHASVTIKRATLISTGTNPDLQFNGWRIAHGVARTTCARYLTQPEYWYEYISSLLSLSNLIHSHQPNVRINSNRISSLRDFSRTNRIGEISQGLVYLYMQNTGFPYVNDFHFFCENNQISIPAKTSTPDFVCQDKNLSNQICLVESKGKEKTSKGDIKSKLAKAISQCVSGENIINTSNIGYNVVKSLGFCSEWSDENNATDSILHFVDPENETYQKDINSAPMRFHYASWFYMIGDFENAQRLIQGEKINFNEGYFRKTTIDDKQYWILWRLPKHFGRYEDFDLSFEIIEELFFSMPFIRTIGVSDEIIKSLTSGEYNEITHVDFKNESTEEYEFFIDGTIILK